MHSPLMMPFEVTTSAALPHDGDGKVRTWEEVRRTKMEHVLLRA